MSKKLFLLALPIGVAAGAALYYLKKQTASDTQQADIQKTAKTGNRKSAGEGDIRTIAAYDISISNDGEEYQPEENPVTVSIQHFQKTAHNQFG